MEPPVSYKPWDLDNPFHDPTLSDRNKQLLNVYDILQRESSLRSLRRRDKGTSYVIICYFCIQSFDSSVGRAEDCRV